MAIPLKIAITFPAIFPTLISSIKNSTMPHIMTKDIRISLLYIILCKKKQEINKIKTGFVYCKITAFAAVVILLAVMKSTLLRYINTAPGIVLRLK